MKNSKKMGVLISEIPVLHVKSTTIIGRISIKMDISWSPNPSYNSPVVPLSFRFVRPYAGIFKIIFSRLLFTIIFKLKMVISRLLSLLVHLYVEWVLRVTFFSESAIRFSNLQISKKKLLQITILNLKLEIPVHNSKQLIQISSSG